MNKNFKFSIVTAVYNTEEYLSDAIDSVLNQTIGFEDNVQLILVNDGSTDRSGEICKEYRDRYPHNIVYIEKENGGVSSARNKGLEEVKGKYVNFLDSDDKLSKNTLEEVWKFFEKHCDEIDFVSIPIQYFEGSNKEHILNFKFAKSKVIDINKQPECIQLHIASSFFNSEIIKKHSFDSRLFYAEDSKLLNEILMQKGKYGVINRTKYLYRQRLSDDSAMQRSISSKNWFFIALEYSFFYLLKESKRRFGKPPLYYQYLVMYDLQFRLKKKDMGLLNEIEKKRYVSIIKEILQDIDDKVIFSQKHYYQEHMIFALSLKYGKTIEQIASEFNIKKRKVYFRKTKFPRTSRLRLNIRNYEIEDGKLKLEGILKTILPEDQLTIYTTSSKTKSEINMVRCRHFDVKALDTTVLKSYIFKIDIPISKEDQIKFAGQFNNQNIKTLYYLNRKPESSYVITQNPKKFILFDEQQITIKNYSKKQHRQYEKNYYSNLIEQKEFTVLALRILYRIFKFFKSKELWLFVERPAVGGDNAQALFEYSVKQKDNVKKVFAIDKKSTDHKKISKFGKVVNWKSYKHLMLFLTCDKFISSHADKFIINPFGKWQKYFIDLFSFDYIFLQHGITKDDISGWLNKMEKNIKLFITAAKPEYNSILQYQYLYSQKEVALTGFPRYDKLINNPKKNIIIMPTWRKFLTSEVNNNGIKNGNPTFTDSDFYNFYNRLITNRRLLEKANDLGYKIKLCLHPAIINLSNTFEEDGVVEVSKEICDYRKELTQGSLLVTDYSSVAFDFAYLRKPVIYTQFDYEKVFSNHIYEKGYFHYRRDGFGPVCKDLKSSIREIIKTIEEGCELNQKYEERINLPIKK